MTTRLRIFERLDSLISQKQAGEDPFIGLGFLQLLQRETPRRPICEGCQGHGTVCAPPYDDPHECLECLGTGYEFPTVLSVGKCQYLRLDTLPANWHEDSSLKTWFPISFEELERLKGSVPEPNPLPCGCRIDATGMLGTICDTHRQEIRKQWKAPVGSCDCPAAPGEDCPLTAKECAARITAAAPQTFDPTTIPHCGGCGAQHWPSCLEEGAELDAGKAS